MSLESAILELAKSIFQLSEALSSKDRDSQPSADAEPRLGGVYSTGKVHGPPTFEEWGSQWPSVSDLSIGSGKGKARMKSCSICGMKGVNARSHPHQ